MPKLRALIKRVDPTDEELLAIIGLAFWSFGQTNGDEQPRKNSFRILANERPLGGAGVAISRRDYDCVERSLSTDDRRG